MSIKRFGVSLDEQVLRKLDDFVKENNFPNRSQAIRFLIENIEVEKKWKCNNIIAGAVIIVYEHDKFDINNKLIDIQHDYHHIIIASQHIHLNHDLCLEIIALKGKAKDITELADKIISLKGVNHGKLIVTKAN